MIAAARFLQKTSRIPKGLQLHLIVDDYATHKHPVVKEWLKRRPRFHLHLTPTSSSWVKMVVRFFLEITVCLRDGRFSSTHELASSIATFFALHNSALSVRLKRER